MDVLFGSIDVRDLLSTQDLEPTSPLSAPDLRLLIDRLNLRSLHIKQNALSYLSSHHSHFSHLLSLSSLTFSKTLDLSSDLSSLLSLLSDTSPLDVDIRHLASQISSKRSELEERKEALRLVRCISALIGRLESAREDLRGGMLIEAAAAVRDLKKAFGVSGSDHEEEDATLPPVFRLLHAEWMECFDEVQDVLARIMENAVTFEPENGRVRVKLRLTVGEIKSVELRTVLMAMDIVGVLDYGLAKVADSMIKHVMIPTVRNGLGVGFVEELNRDSQQKDEAILSLILSPNYQVEYSNGATIFSRLLQVTKFIYKSICFSNGTWMQCFGRLTWPRISELVISEYLSKAVPDDSIKIAELQNVVKLTTEFETALKEMMFISATDRKDDKLSTFAQNVEVHFASRKKKEILAKARNLLLQREFVLSLENLRKGPNFYSHGVTGNASDYAVDLLFQPERCLVSKAASQLMELVHQTLQGIRLSSTRVAMEFYHAARDALLLYEAIVPVKYCSDFPNGVKEHAVFVDIPPRFHQMAEEILQKQIKLVIFSLNEAIDGADGFQNTHQMQQYESAKFSLDQVVFILEKVHIVWEPLLLPSTYKRIMCKILDSVFSRITKDLLLLDDMAAEETLQLQRLIHITLESLSSLFESLVADAKENEKFSDSYIWIQLEKLLPSLRKLRKLADLLDMPLKSITASWESGQLVSCGFTPFEMENFVKAIFTDSPLRKECLWRIGKANS
ncbi:centromere/kinetochore protein zw10 homolog isoform X2 [Magnolia sinica]|uniref:centromere/kinetochore protein zw10 homolog isoform X2 n=1 Tax=Magnolia sinica TaxID=86752 RepID=UPI00265B20B1|nr:centromere/kinetochore protein zw10 homolog isoform X2 [Magnolia sinica]